MIQKASLLQPRSMPRETTSAALSVCCLASLRELSNGLVEQLNKGNSPHHHLLARASAYRDLINHEVEQIDFAMLYIAGVLGDSARLGP